MLPKVLSAVLLSLLLVPIVYAQDVKPTDPPAIVERSVLVPATAPYDAAATPKVNRTFRATLLKAAEQAYRDKEISRFELARIRIASVLRPQVIAEAQAVATEEAVTAKVMSAQDAGAVTAFDWSKLLDFLIKILPLLLALFG
jgi:hypothetical protein